MPLNMTKAMAPGDPPPEDVTIFQEVGPRGGKTKHYIAHPKGRPLPHTKKSGNFWYPCTIHELQAGIS